ncbi:MAG: hypothetical protein GX973_07315 [Firmicutes bacterium]|nr:hypothetical protein [Bacillota bacterium]
MLCTKCGESIHGEEIFVYAGQNYCEDCYLETMSVLKTCDPMAVRSARLTRERLGQRGTEGLLPVQKKIVDFVQKRGKVTREQVVEALKIEPEELEKHFSILRHCELVKGLKEGNRLYLILMDAEL